MAIPKDQLATGIYWLLTVSPFLWMMVAPHTILPVDRRVAIVLYILIGFAVGSLMALRRRDRKDPVPYMLLAVYVLLIVGALINAIMKT